MFHTENIETIGWIDVTSDDFTNLTRRSVATIYPSCSEGGGGSVLTCMHAGLIPVVTHEASVDVEDFGLLLEPATIDKIRETVHHLSDAPSTELEKRSRAAWRYARENHTREIFRQYYRRFVRNIVRPELEQRINS